MAKHPRDLFDLGQYPPEVENHAIACMERLLDLNFVMSAGRSRITLAHPKSTYVIKIPRCEMGMAHNFSEARASRNHFRGEFHIPMPRARIFYLDQTIGLPLLMMRYVEHASMDLGKMPDWAYQVDCFQIGHTAQGDLVAYDL